MDTSMNRNKAMRTAAVMLVLALASACAISGVLAKYVVTDNGTDTARVAKFGVVTSAVGDLFGSSYHAVADGNTIQAWEQNAPTVAAFDGKDTLVVAPGTKNDQGMTFTVKGTPEVSTKLTLDAPEGESGTVDDKNYVNTDIFLKAGSYAIMAKQAVSDVVITKDNCGDFYTYAGNAFTQVTASTIPTTGDVYKRIAMNMGSADYYPIKWKVNGTEIATQNVETLQTTVAEALAGAVGATTANGVTTASHVPNYTYEGTAGNGLAKVTWEWAFGTAWEDVASDTVAANWENTTNADFADTLLGEMIAQAATSGGIADYKVAVMAANNASGTEVQYEQIDADSDSANKVYVAFTGSAPSKWSDANVACLTVTFGERITVEQVD